MTAKDFRILAAALAANRPDPERDGLAAMTLWADLVDGIARACATTNPRFDRERFLVAAGMAR